MHHFALLLIVIYHLYLARSQFPYPNQSFKLPNHPANSISTVHVTVTTFASHVSSDITERFLTSYLKKIIPTISAMHNRSITIAQVISFFEPCTISILIDATIKGSSYLSRENRIAVYITANKYVHCGWIHSSIIVIHFTCSATYYSASRYLPHRIFYHSTKCGPQNIFPNHVYVPGPLQYSMTIYDQKHNIHVRKLPLDTTSLILIYSWDRHNPNRKLEFCFSKRRNCCLLLSTFSQFHNRPVYPR
jgi:hypothetical protein